MKLLFTCIAWLALTFSANATFVQGASGSIPGSGTSATATLGAGVTTGNAVWGTVNWFNTGLTVSVTVGGVAATIVDTITDVGNTIQVATFVLGNVSGSPTSVVATTSGTAQFITVIAIEESGVLAVSNPVDVHNGQLQVTPGTGANILTSPSVTTTVANAIIVGAAGNSTSGLSATAGTSPNAFTLRTSSTVEIPLFTEDGVVKATAGAVAATFGQATNDTWITLVMALKPTGGGGGGTANPRLIPLMGAGK